MQKKGPEENKTKNLFWGDPRIRIDDTFELIAVVAASPTHRGVDWVDGCTDGWTDGSKLSRGGWGGGVLDVYP